MNINIKKLVKQDLVSPLTGTFADLKKSERKHFKLLCQIINTMLKIASWILYFPSQKQGTL